MIIRPTLNPSLFFVLVLTLFLGIQNVAIASPLTDKCNAARSQGPEMLISRITCFKDEYYRLIEFKKKIQQFIGFGNSIRGSLAPGDQTKYQCRDTFFIKQTYIVPRKVSGGRCSDLKNQYGDTFSVYYRDYCLGYSSVGDEMEARYAKLRRLNKAYKSCFTESVLLLIPGDIRKGERLGQLTDHSGFNDRDGFIVALNQLRDRWKTNNYEGEIELLAKTCNDLLSYAESKYAAVANLYQLSCR